MRWLEEVICLVLCSRNGSRCRDCMRNDAMRSHGVRVVFFAVSPVCLQWNISLCTMCTGVCVEGMGRYARACDLFSVCFTLFF